MFYLKYYWILYVYCTSAGILSLFLFIHKQCENAKEWAFNDFEKDVGQEYDYIVVGGGSAGSVLAGRLGAGGEERVLLVEAGGSSTPLHDIPLSAPLYQRTQYDWQYKTLPQDNACLGLNEKVSLWPMGKILGGTSRLNYMIYVRGHIRDFDTWRHGQHWSPDDILHYFKRSELQDGHYREDTKHHGWNGPVYVSDLNFQTDLADALLSAGEEIGYKKVELNSLNSSPGLMINQVTGHMGRRWSSEHALKHKLNKHHNVHILLNTLVEKVLIRDKFEAYGIVCRLPNGHTREVHAKKAVILSAGTVGSPKILMLSGIGPFEHLSEHNIEPLVNLPVGQNLQDHVTTGLDLVLLNVSLPISSTTILTSPINAYHYLMNGDGVMTHPGCEVVGLFHLNNELLPDLQLMALPAGMSTDAGAVLRKAMSISDKVWEGYFAPLVGRQVATLLPTLLHPKSVGELRLKSNDPTDPPLINPNYLKNPYDVQVLIKGLKLIGELLKTESLKKLGARLNTAKMPGCEEHEFGTDIYWECYVRHLTLTAYHPVGTCSMGSVVDYDLSVHQLDKLFVVDASIMPTLPSGNINAAVLMIAEKGADLIRAKWNRRRHSCDSLEVFIPSKFSKR